jgi:putative addiction module killer protein
LGNLGHVKPVGGGVSELKVNVGPGYRLYCITTDTTVIVLLCGGDKSNQKKDIETAKRMAAERKTAP